MRSFSLAVVVSSFSMSAFAADMPPVAYPEQAFAPASAYDWTGFYVGAHAGGGFGKFQDVGNSEAAEQETDGAFGGLQVGYAVQYGALVAGLEADVSFGDVGKEWGGANEFDPYYGEDKHEIFGTVRGRLGYAFDRFLPYITGGLAWSKNSHTLGCDADRVVATQGCQNRIGGVAFENEVDDTTIGWTIGAGAEVAFSDNWRFKLEYAFLDFGDDAEVFIADPNYPDIGDRVFENHVHTVKAGINYRF